MPPSRLHPDEGAARIGRVHASASATRKDYGLKLPGEAEIDYVQMAASAATRSSSGCGRGSRRLVDKNKVTWIQGRGRLEGANKVRVAQAGEDGTPGKGGERVLQATT